jgi:hypothetical protein
MNKLKKILTAVVLLVACAVGANAATEVDEIINSSCTLTMVLVNTTATLIDSGALDTSSGTVNNLMNNRKVIEVQNQSLSDMRLSFSNLVSSVRGRILNPGASWVINLKARDQDGVRLKVWGLWTGVSQGTMSVVQCGSK